MAGDITVNGRRHRVTAAPDTPLLLVLRNELRLNGPKFAAASPSAARAWFTSTGKTCRRA